MSLPPYYSRLAPFREAFLQGRAILTYHHIGRRPRGARLKGLYVSPKLFARQLAELDVAGFTTTTMAETVGPERAAEPSVALTFDDGFRDAFEHALPVLAARRFRAIQFLVSELIGGTNLWQQKVGDVRETLMDEGEVRAWLAAGHEIGSHTRTHPRLTQIPLPAAKEEISASKKSLEDRFGVPIRHFCYPYGDWSRAVSELVAEAGYQTACTTAGGVNVPGGSPFELKRVTARYPTRNFKALWARLRGG